MDWLRFKIGRDRIGKFALVLQLLVIYTSIHKHLCFLNVCAERNQD